MTKLRLTLLVAAVLAVVALPLVGRAQQSSRRAWEYTTIVKSRGFEAVKEGDWREAGDWSGWSQDDRKLSGEVNMIRKLAELGSQG
jgi:hypothetical protein